jgi:acyl-CoA synthetase (AMP-forming)/AMP-acid ligase II
VLVPFCHAFGNSILQTHILAGATMIVGLSLTFPDSIVQALGKFGATSFSAIPETFGGLLQYGRLGERPLPNLRYMSVAGGGIRPDLAENIAAQIAPATFHVMYGQSEATARLASLPPDQLVARRGSIGKPVAGVELAVRDESGRDLPPGEGGMLYARGKNIMLGYWNDEAATAKVLARDGWLHTGDMAHRDEAGYFYLDGRANLLVKIQGHRVHPAEVEGVVEAHFPNTRAVALPMARGAETRFALFVAPQNGQPVDVAHIRAVCIRELAAYKVPLHVEIIDTLPLNSAHKIDRAALSLRIPQS